MKRNHIMLGLMFVSTAATLVFTRHDADDAIVEAAPRTHAASASPRASSAAAVVAIAALQTRAAQGDAAGDAHRKLFGTTLLAPALPAAASAGADIPPLPTGTLASDMPFTYIGKESSDGRWQVFLSRGDETLIVHEQSIIDGAYR